MMTDLVASEVTDIQTAIPEKKLKGRALLLYDLKHPKLIPVKFLSFIILSGAGVLFPFVTIHMKSLGMTIEETGVVYGVSSVAAVLSPFLIGLVADKIGNFKILMSAVYGFIVLVALSFLLIPVGRLSKKLPVHMTLAMGCNSDQVTLGLTDLDSRPCKIQPTNEGVANVSVVLEQCGSVCYDKSNPPEGNELDRDANSTHLVNFVIPSPVREFHDAIFFQNDWHLDFSCTQMANGEDICIVKHDSRQVSKNITLGLGLSANSTNVTEAFSVKWMVMEDDDKLNHFQCGSYGNEQKMHETIYVHDTNLTDNNRTLYRFCRSQCIVQVTFWLYVLLRFVFEISLGGLDLFVGAAVVLVNECNGDIGFQRMFGYVGIAVFSPLSGALIDNFSTANDGQGNVMPAFLLFAGIYTIAAFGILMINLDFKPPAENPLKDLGTILKNIELDALLIVAFISGTINSYCANYMFLFLQDIGGTRALMGSSNAVQSVTLLPLLLFSDRIFRKLGHPNLQALCLTVNFGRLLGYSYLYDPRLCLFFESLDALCWNFARTSHIAHANDLSTLTTVASIQGLLGAITFGLGQGIGSVSGSLLIGAYGQRVTFRIMASISLITGVLYFVFNLRPRKKECTK